MADSPKQCAHGYWNSLDCNMCKQDKEIAALRERLEKCEKDTERYRWLRSNKYIDIAACWLVSPDVNSAGELDAAIDAALSAKGGKT